MVWISGNEMAHCIKVALRVRPQSKNELARGCQSIVSKTRNDNQIIIDGFRSKELYTFNYVFDVEDTQQTIYESSVEPMLTKLFEGKSLYFLIVTLNSDQSIFQ